MSRITEELTFYLGSNDQVQVETLVTAFITPGRRSGSYYEPDDPTEVEIEGYEIERVICISANGEETVLPNQFVARWLPLIMSELKKVVYTQETEDEMYEYWAHGHGNY